MAGFHLSTETVDVTADVFDVTSDVANQTGDWRSALGRGTDDVLQTRMAEDAAAAAAAPWSGFTGAPGPSSPALWPGLTCMALVAGVAQVVIGVLILLCNTLVLIVLRKVSTLSVVTRILLANLAVADMIFGGGSLVRGALSLRPDVIDVNDYCVHVVAIINVGILQSLGATALISGHMFYVAINGMTYNDVRTTQVVKGIAFVVALAAGAWYPAAFPFQQPSENFNCSANSGHVRMRYFKPVIVLSLALIVFSSISLVLSAAFLRRSMRSIGVLQFSFRILYRRTTRVGPAPLDTSSIATISRVTETQLPASATLRDISPSVEVTDLTPRRLTLTPRRLTLIPREPFKSFDRKEHEQYLRVSTAHARQEAEMTQRACYRPGHRGSVIQHIRRERHALRIIATVLLCLVLSTSPALVVQLINAFVPRALQGVDIVFPTAMTALALFNPLCNVFIYYLKDKSFRKVTRNIFSGKYFCLSN